MVEAVHCRTWHSCVWYGEAIVMDEKVSRCDSDQVTYAQKDFYLPKEVASGRLFKEKGDPSLWMYNAHPHVPLITFAHLLSSSHSSRD